MTASTSDVAALLLQRLVQFAGKPSDLLLSTGSGRMGRPFFGALRRFGSCVFARRALMVLPPALERLFIASPVG